jgi:phospholipase A1
LSVKIKLAQDILFKKADLWLGYTQKSFFQVYNNEFSRPFRETNYEPELILNFPVDFKIFGLEGKMVGVSINHQSNGRTQTLSRSWNRVMGFAAFEEKNWSLILRAWYAFQLEDNPDIKDYTGRADATFVYLLKRNIITVHGQHSLRTGAFNNGQIQIDWGFPIKGNLRGHFQFFNGYGDSMIDHNYKQTIFGLGVSFSELL